MSPTPVPYFETTVDGTTVQVEPRLHGVGFELYQAGRTTGVVLPIEQAKALHAALGVMLAEYAS